MKQIHITQNVRAHLAILCIEFFYLERAITDALVQTPRAAIGYRTLNPDTDPKYKEREAAKLLNIRTIILCTKKVSFSTDDDVIEPTIQFLTSVHTMLYKKRQRSPQFSHPARIKKFNRHITHRF